MLQNSRTFTYFERPMPFYLRRSQAGLVFVRCLLLLAKFKKKPRTANLTSEDWFIQPTKAIHSKYEVRIDLQGHFQGQKAKNQLRENNQTSAVLTKFQNLVVLRKFQNLDFQRKFMLDQTSNFNFKI